LEFYLIVEVNLKLRPASFSIKTIALLHERYTVLIRLCEISWSETDHLKLEWYVFPIVWLQSL